MAGFTIKVHKGEKLWMADCDELSIYATGRTVNSALTEFQCQIKCFKRYYREQPLHALTRHAAKLKDRFAELG